MRCGFNGCKSCTVGGSRREWEFCECGIFAALLRRLFPVEARLFCEKEMRSFGIEF